MTNRRISTDTRKREEQDLYPAIQALEQTCQLHEQCVPTFDESKYTHLGSSSLADIEASCEKVETVMLMLQDLVSELHTQRGRSQRRVEDQTQHIKRLQEKLVSFHRKNVSMTEEIRTLDATRRAMETERRRLELIKDRGMSGQNAELSMELDEARGLLEKNNEETSRLRELL